MASSDVVWQLVKNSNSFLVKGLNNSFFSRELGAAPRLRRLTAERTAVGGPCAPSWIPGPAPEGETVP